MARLHLSDAELARLREEFIEQFKNGRMEILPVNDRIERLEDQIKELQEALSEAWGLIANAGGGNWDANETDQWIEAAERWRDTRLHRPGVSASTALRWGFAQEPDDDG